ncbi:retinol dehydrogenase 13-like [Harmonia axyridis]|uniref:retinol dehydrogenase 13-like n=1 Tax=Harmonia axyridis TaxID=115357 RepID=UPI001E275C0F|nr:retinol dehydrogenase 13-like [Harmonia axyridis]
MIPLIQIVNLFLYVFSRLIENIPFRKIPISTKCLVGKTAIVTGGNRGIGFATATALASRGCKVIIADSQNGELSRDQIISDTENKNIVYKHLDLSSLQSVRDFAADICKTEDKIDILINNAGIGVTKKLVSEDGLNYIMQVNIFGAFLLTHLLLDLLKKAKSARVLFVSSIFVNTHNLNLDTLNITNYNMDDHYRTILYSNSKVCCILAAQEFNRKLKKHGIIANAIDPIGVKTQIFQTMKYFNNVLVSSGLALLLNIFHQNVQDVANHYLHVITEKDEEESTGQNYVLSSIARKPTILKNSQFCEDIWCKMEEIVGLKPKEKISS